MCGRRVKDKNRLHAQSFVRLCVTVRRRSDRSFDHTAHSRFMWYKRNKRLQDVLLLEYNQRRGGNCNCASSRHTVVDYFPVTVHFIPHIRNSCKR